MALRMDEQSPKIESDIPSRTHVHIVLALIFVPCAAALGAWIFAIRDVFAGTANAAQRKWLRLLFALALVDTLAMASAVGMGLHQDELQPTGPRPVIGVFFEKESGLKVRQLVPRLPAERAGLRVEDEIQEIDDIPVETVKELNDALAEEKAGTARSLTVRRGEEILELTVTPEVPPRPAKKGLFEPMPAPVSRGLREGLLGFLPAALIVAVLALWIRLKRRATVPVWGGFVLASVGGFGAAAGTLHLGKSLLGGWSLGLILLTLLVQMSAMLLLTLAARAWLSRPLEPAPALLTPLRAGLQGLFYLVTGFPRLVLLLWMVNRLFFGGHGVGDQTLERLATSPLGVTGTLLFIFNVALLGPFAEELLFRGFLVPRLALQWGETAALFGSSLIFALFHPHYGPYMPVVFLYGWVFGWARLRSGSIVASTGLHMTVNGLVTALMFARG